MMTASKKELSKSERKHRKQRLMMIESARKLFETRPFDDVSMDEIADEAAISKQTLYNYFSSKEAIYFAIAIEDFRATFERSDSAILSGLAGTEQVLKLSENYFKTLIDFPLNAEIGRRFIITNNQMEGIADSTLKAREKKKGQLVDKKKQIEDVLADYLEQVWKYEGFWETAISNGIRDGSIKTELTAPQLTQYILMLIPGVVDQMQLKRIPLTRVKLNEARAKQVTLQLIERLLS